MEIFKKFFEVIGDSLFTNFKCMFCGVETVNESLICPKCQKTLVAIRNPVCNKCGAIVDKSDDVCYTCFDKNYIFNKHRSCFVYDELSSIPVKGLKYSEKKYLAEPMARVMYAFNQELFNNIDVITYVPMTDKRKKIRGYNQCELLANELSKITDIEFKKLLDKDHETEHQADLNFAGRTKNLKGSFIINKVNIDYIKNKNILIIDDVFTTGSTIHECSRVLLKNNAHSVSALTFVKTDPFKQIQDLPF